VYPVARAGDCQCCVRGDGETNTEVAHPNVGGRMKRLSLVLGVCWCAAQFLPAWLSHPVAAAGPTAAPTTSTTMERCSPLSFPVLRHPRCMNCHSKGDYPRQGDDSHRHTMDIRRGSAGNGVTSVKCSTCHQDHNLGGGASSAGRTGLAPATAEHADDLGRIDDAQLL